MAIAINEAFTICGTYTKDGEEKARWLKVGVVFMKENGKTTLKIDSLPNNFNGWIELVPVKPKA